MRLSTTRPDGATFQSFTYGYDANGNRVSQADGTGTTSFTYDALNRLTPAAYPGTYGSWSWTYDTVGNRTSQTAPSGTTPYTYNEVNRLTQAGAVTYSYDDNGNLISTSAGQSFSWDTFNRLTGASGSGGSVSYTYNGDGLKLAALAPMALPSTTTTASARSGRPTAPGPPRSSWTGTSLGIYSVAARSVAAPAATWPMTA